MIRISQLRLDVLAKKEAVKAAAAKKLHIAVSDVSDFSIERRSLDARKKPKLYYVYSVLLRLKEIKEEKLVKRLRDKDISLFTPVDYTIPDLPSRIEGMEKEQYFQKEENRPVIVGFGPAGLFAGLLLSRAGLRPIIYERGEAVEKRMKTVEKLWTEGILNPNSNAQFGEGGAGTFSDGKLNTLVKDKEGRSHFVLKTFVEKGAKEEILYESKPHVGTDALIGIVSSIRKEIERLGGEVRFETQYHFHKEEKRPLIIAIGHSARDSFQELFSLGFPIVAKDFAMGFRVEHPQEEIDRALFGKVDEKTRAVLGPASYKLIHHSRHGRAFYSFCMCPGGYVVNSSSEPQGLCINGMSYSGRDSGKANSAIIFSITKEEYGGAENPLAGIALQSAFEKKAYSLANGNVPFCRYDIIKNDVIKNEESKKEESKREYPNALPMLKGIGEECDLSSLFTLEEYPALRFLKEDFVESMEAFARQISCFADAGTLVYGVESRTSSPLRILRAEDFRSMNRRIYPSGEGAGYAGGIMSAAMDGMKVAESLILSYYSEVEKRESNTEIHRE